MGRLRKEDVPWAEYISYDPDTGTFTWIKKGSRKIIAGSPACNHTKPDGYLNVTLWRVTVNAHHLAWYLATGSHVPKGKQIDHVNRIRGDNRFTNLRLCTRTQNNANSSLQSRRHGKFKNVMPTANGRWKTQVFAKRKTVFCGTFDTAEEAAIAADKIARRLYGEFAFLNCPERKTV